ncbi:MAG: hypothetical protein AB1428_13150 [Bacteroidota bacterium]
MTRIEVKLLIDLDEHNGLVTAVNVQAPLPMLSNKFLCYAVLEAAKDAVRDYRPPQVQPASGAELELLKKRNGGA